MIPIGFPLFLRFYLCHDLVIRLFTDTLLCVPAPLDAGQDIVVDNETAVAALYGHIIGEEFDFLAALGTFFYREGWCAQVCCAGAVVQHDTTRSVMSACRHEKPAVVPAARHQQRGCSRDR
jgi:hypothetical protein